MFKKGVKWYCSMHIFCKTSNCNSSKSAKWVQIEDLMKMIENKRANAVVTFRIMGNKKKRQQLIIIYKEISSII